MVSRVASTGTSGHLSLCHLCNSTHSCPSHFCSTENKGSQQQNPALQIKPLGPQQGGLGLIASLHLLSPPFLGCMGGFHKVLSESPASRPQELEPESALSNTTGEAPEKSSLS